MYKILEKSFFSDNVVRLVVEAPEIARSRKAGHFVIVRVGEQGERIPLTIADADVAKGTITLVAQRVGVSTARFAGLNAGDSLTDLVGPLGKATDIRNYGTVVCACGGVGAAPMFPIAQALKNAGNRVIVILAARNKSLIMLEDEFRGVADEVRVMTDDGSYGDKGLVTVGVEDVINREKVDKCFAIGPGIMMKFTALTTKKYGIPTDCSLNTIMVDGTGMCGACRVTVGGKTRFVCVDGPEFDAHEVDFDELLMRQGAYKAEEVAAYESFLNQEPEVKHSEPETAPSAASQHLRKSGCEACSNGGNDRNAPWRAELRSAIKPKERTARERVKMNELAPEERIHSLTAEVNRGLTEQQAVAEATRCLDCPNPGCVTGCPVGIDIPGFVKNIERGEYLTAASVIKQSSTLPAVCGRVCPQEKQCESQCIHFKMGHQPVAIGYLERFAADYERETGNMAMPEMLPANGKKIAVVGSGPAGLAFAGDMAKYGYKVEVFEALHQIGGVLKYGIPEYRLPNSIVDTEIDLLRKMGVVFHKNIIIGKTISVEQLKNDGFNGIFVATGAGLPRFMDIKGENLIGVMSSNEYLTRVNLMGAADGTSDTPVMHGKRVAVIGGGNTAMDAVRTARRLGAEATIVYRRGTDEMPARAEEVKHAEEEGVIFLTLHNPIEYHGDDKGHVTEMVLQVMELGEPDASGRRSPVPVEGVTKTLPVDMVIVAIGVSPNPIVPRNTEGLNVSRKGTIEVDENLESSLPMLFAGGDIVRGGATVILAMADGRNAAKAMHEKLSKK